MCQHNCSSKTLSLRLTPRAGPKELQVLQALQAVETTGVCGVAPTTTTNCDWKSLKHARRRELSKKCRLAGKQQALLFPKCRAAAAASELHFFFHSTSPRLLTCLRKINRQRGGKENEWRTAPATWRGGGDGSRWRAGLERGKRGGEWRGEWDTWTGAALVFHPRNGFRGLVFFPFLFVCRERREII